ncbi:MAG TPA: 23S rRNA (guanosine(2251)-2'-O)-methyltransferase RlmB, partial [Clostridia bacterium]|nr:23S rRNA (guanosine(2251)-2'-O)-methyltransferase RlmB [Clostridia bacterium]
YGEKKPYGDKPYGSKPYGGSKPYENKKPSAVEPLVDDAELDEIAELSADAEPKKTRYALKYDAMAPASEEAAAQAKNVPEDELPYLVMGRNAVREALKSGRSIDRILVVKELDGSLREIVNLARDNNVQLREVDRSKLDELCMPFGHGNKTGNHQGIVAMVPGVQYCELNDILEVAKAKNEKPFLILLDGIEDPHNLGSIIRSAECAGAHGVVIPKRRTATVTSAACKASAGAVEYIKVARVVNMATAVEQLKKEGIWIAGADMDGTPMTEAKLEGAIALVIGSEGEGISRLVREACDFTVKIPLSGSIESLNASVAAAILMFEKKRQDGAKA